MTASQDLNPICCPPFDPIPWDDHTFEWNEKPFIRDRVFTLFYMPLNFGAVMKKFDRKVRETGAVVPENLCLSEHTSKWNMNLYLAVDKQIPNADNTILSGKFFSKVYEGPFQDTEKWMKDFESISKADGLKINKHYLWYTTCPKCAKKYGKNYVVIIGQME